jgi:hypothetical protein
MMMKPVPDENPIREGVINRFFRKEEVMATEWVFDEDEGEVERPTDIDVVWIDRMTDTEVLRYDGVDPANRPPLGPSDAEVLARKGIDVDEEIAISLCKTPPTESEIARYVWMQARKVEKQQEIERGEELLGELDLWSYLELDAVAFDFSNYAEQEQTILKPALERKGFTRVAFFMGEQDSFGPLSRGIRAWKGDKSYVFYYG